MPLNPELIHNLRPNQQQFIVNLLRAALLNNQHNLEIPPKAIPTLQTLFEALNYNPLAAHLYACLSEKSQTELGPIQFESPEEKTTPAPITTETTPPPPIQSDPPSTLEDLQSAWQDPQVPIPQFKTLLAHILTESTPTDTLFQAVTTTLQTPSSIRNSGDFKTTIKTLILCDHFLKHQHLDPDQLPPQLYTLIQALLHLSEDWIAKILNQLPIPILRQLTEITDKQKDITASPLCAASMKIDQAITAHGNLEENPNIFFIKNM